MACVDLPAFPLQLLLRRHPDWRVHPAAVVDVDEPQGLIRAVNDRARSLGIRPGMRYSASLALAADLRAAPVTPTDIDRSVAEISERLSRFTPGVEPSDGEPGVFWLDASGLERLHASLGQWAGLVRSDLERSGLRSAVVVGFGRFGTYAVARSMRGAVVLSTHAEELAAARRVGLDRLALPPAALDALHKLGIDTVGAFAGLPAGGIVGRFGPEVQRLHRAATGSCEAPLRPHRPVPPAQERLRLDDPETDVQRLLGVIERLMHPLLSALSHRGLRLAGLHIGFRFERLGDHIEHLKPAAPTLDADVLLDLVRLRLAALRTLPEGVIEIVLLADEVPAEPAQVPLCADRPRRDLAAANRALARVRAELGDGAVTHARLHEGHLPEASFAWEPIETLVATRPGTRRSDAPGSGRVVRRIYTQPRPLARRQRRETDGWILAGLEQGTVVRFLGPYIVAGGWWHASVHREYHFAETQKGEIVWIYYDRGERRWFLHGRVE